MKHEVSYCIKPSLVVNILAYPNLLGKKGYVVVVVVVNILKISTKLLLNATGWQSINLAISTVSTWQQLLV